MNRGSQNSAKVSLFLTDLKKFVFENNFQVLWQGHIFQPSCKYKCQGPLHTQGTLRKWYWMNKAFLSPAPGMEPELFLIFLLRAWMHRGFPGRA